MDAAQLAVSIATIGMSGVVSAVVTYQLTARREWRQLRGEKLEAVFRAFSGYVVQLGVNWIPLIGAMRGSLTYNTALEMNAKHGAGPNLRCFEDLEMLIAIYFPELQPLLDELIAIRDRANAVIADHKRTYREIGPHPTSAVDEMRHLSEDLGQLEDRFQTAIRLEALRLYRRRAS